MNPLHICIAGPIATEHVAEFLSGDIGSLPEGYTGAPLTAVLIGELLKMGHKVTAITTDLTTFQKNRIIKASGDNFDFYLCPLRPRAWRPNRRWLGRGVDAFAYERRYISQIMNETKPDIIHVHWSYEFAMAALRTGIPHVITCHDDPAAVLRYTFGPYRMVRYWMASTVFRQGRLFSTVSDYMAKALQRYLKLPIAIVPNPLAEYVMTTGRVRPLPESRRIGLISNGWDERKNPKPALTAFASFRLSHPNAELHLYGYDFGPEERAYHWCSEQGLLEGVHFHGMTPHKELIARLDELDLLLHPALEESFGVVIAEAMALGLPVVAGLNSGAIPWVTGYEAGKDASNCALLVDVSDSTAIATALAAAFDENYPLRSQAGFSRAREQFSPQEITQSYYRLYLDALQNQKPIRNI